METSRPTLSQIVRVDNSSSLYKRGIQGSLMVAVLSFYFIYKEGIGTILLFLHGGTGAILLWVSVVFFILSIAALFLRYRMIISVFDDNTEVPAVITGVNSSADETPSRYRTLSSTEMHDFDEKLRIHTIFTYEFRKRNISQAIGYGTTNKSRS